MPLSSLLNTPSLIIYLSAIETPICHREIEFNRVYILRFSTKYDTRFSEYRIELIVSLSSANATKINKYKKRFGPRTGWPSSKLSFQMH